MNKDKVWFIYTISLLAILINVPTLILFSNNLLINTIVFLLTIFTITNYILKRAVHNICNNSVWYKDDSFTIPKIPIHNDEIRYMVEIEPESPMIVDNASSYFRKNSAFQVLSILTIGVINLYNILYISSMINRPEYSLLFIVLICANYTVVVNIIKYMLNKMDTKYNQIITVKASLRETYIPMTPRFFDLTDKK